MNEMDKLGVLEKKLGGVCDKNDLIYKFRYDHYPITLTIRPAGGMNNQMSMLESTEADEGNYTSPDDPGHNRTSVPRPPSCSCRIRLFRNDLPRWLGWRSLSSRGSCFCTSSTY